MKIPLPALFPETPDTLRLLTVIDEFSAKWNRDGIVDDSVKEELREVTIIESTGSSTRIEGSRLTDDEVGTLIGNLKTQSFRTRDEQEVAGYAEVIQTVQESWEHLVPSENLLLQLHRDLLIHSEKDERHRGAYKTLPNHVAAFDLEKKVVGIVFETATPFETPELMRQLIEWLREDEEKGETHPLVRIAAFKVAFLAIHPFQDGNGRLSRILTNLLMLRAGYDFVSYSAFENVIEKWKPEYYHSLRQTQVSFGREVVRWEPWIDFFLRAVDFQVMRLRQRTSGNVSEGFRVTYRVVTKYELSPLAERLRDELRTRGTLTVSEAVDALGANRNTLKDKFSELVVAGEARLCGKGRGAHYRLP